MNNAYYSLEIRSKVGEGEKPRTLFVKTQEITVEDTAEGLALAWLHTDGETSRTVLVEDIDKVFIDGEWRKPATLDTWNIRSR